MEYYCCYYRYTLGILIARFGKLSGIIITLANIIQTVPVIAMLAILMLIGLGINTVIFTVFLYALLPIIKIRILVLMKWISILKMLEKEWE